MLDTLKKIYYTSPEQHHTIYMERFNFKLSRKLPLTIKEFNHHTEYPLFYYYTEELALLQERISRKYLEFMKLLDNTSPLVLLQFSLSCIVDEVDATSKIEGVHSSKRELKAILEGGSTSGRFSGILRKYYKLSNGEEIILDRPEDIRDIYEDIAYMDILKDKPEYTLDGKIFRADDVDVLSTSGKILHRGVSPEEKLIDYLRIGLEFMKNEQVPYFVRVAVFHYVFVYAHPFYDGNGRTARFITSSQIARTMHYLPALRLSYIIRRKVHRYYELIHDTELEINCGDLSPFIYGFISFILETLEDLVLILQRKHEQLKRYRKRLENMIPDDEDIIELYGLLLESSVFIGSGISMERLIKHTEKSRNTILKRLAKISPEHLVIIKGRKYFYKLNMLMFKDMEGVIN